MKMNVALFAVTGMLMVSSSTLAADKKDPDKVICRPSQVDTGSIMGKKICRTRAEWASLSKKGEEDLARLRQKTNVYAKGPGNDLD